MTPIPLLKDVNGWRRLPDGAGSVGFTATVRGADQVRSYLLPTVEHLAATAAAAE